MFGVGEDGAKSPQLEKTAAARKEFELAPPQGALASRIARADARVFAPEQDAGSCSHLLHPWREIGDIGIDGGDGPGDRSPYRTQGSMTAVGVAQIAPAVQEHG